MSQVQDRKPKLMVVASADSPLLRDRALIGVCHSFEVLWFSESFQHPVANCTIVHSRKMKVLGPLNKLRAAWCFINAYRKFKPDVVHVHWAVFPVLMIKLTWPGLIVSPMGSDIFHPGIFRFREIISSSVLRKAVLVTSKSEFMKERLISMGVSSGQIRKITWGVDQNLFKASEKRSELRRQMGIKENELVFFSVRALKPLYRINEIVRSFKEYIQNGGEGTLLVSEMSGEKADRERLRSIVESMGAEGKVILLGHINAGEMRNYYAISDAVVSYAKTDGMPQSLYESMAVGCYPIFTKLPNYEELIQHKVNGYLCDSDDASSLVHAFEFVLSCQCVEKVIAKNRDKIRTEAVRSYEREKMRSIYSQVAARTMECGNS